MIVSYCCTVICNYSGVAFLKYVKNYRRINLALHLGFNTRVNIDANGIIVQRLTTNDKGAKMDIESREVQPYLYFFFYRGSCASYN
jgi:hypothetical protein